MTVEPVRADEVYALSVEAWNRTHRDGWQWQDLSGAERDRWMEHVTPIVRAVLEAQRGL